jgi:signal transduction histidine kinase
MQPVTTVPAGQAPRRLVHHVGPMISNAVKFTPEGGRISLKACRTDGLVEIAVTDTGIGIAPEDQAAIFEAGHLPGAINIPLKTLSRQTTTIREHRTP